MSKKETKRANSIISVQRMDGKLHFTVHGIGVLTLDPEKVSQENRSRAMFHGFEQRVRDAGALSVDRDTGKSATPQEKFDAMSKVAEHLNSGAAEWTMKPAASPGVDAGLVLLAIMRVYGKTLEAAETVIAASMAKRGLDRTGALKLWAASDKVAAMMLVIKTERLTSTIDSDDLLDEMEDDEPEGEDDTQ